MWVQNQRGFSVIVHTDNQPWHIVENHLSMFLKKIYSEISSWCWNSPIALESKSTWKRAISERCDWKKCSGIFVLRHIELMLKFTRCFSVNIEERGFLIHTCALTFSYVWPVSFIYVRHRTHSYISNYSFMCDMDGSRGTHATHRADVEIHALLRSQHHSSQRHRGIFLLGVMSQEHLKPPSPTHTPIQNIGLYVDY